MRVRWDTSTLLLRAAAALLLWGDAHPQDWSAAVTGEVRVFAQETDSEIRRTDPSLVVEVEYRPREHVAGGEVRAKGFLRLDGQDGHRTHADLRQLVWTREEGDLDVKVGVDTVFWGVTEFDHMIDIVNQTDWVEDPRGTEKLGQPMVAGAFHSGVGSFELLLLPAFRKRTFPDLSGRLQTYPPTDPAHEDFAAPNGANHVDWVGRWSYSGTGWDVGVYHFEGTSRSPRFLLTIEGTQPVLLPRYDLVSQDAFDGQVAVGHWLWKMEGFYQHDGARRYAGATGGFEYTFTGVGGTRADCGLVGELIRDHRPDGAAGYLQNEVAVGVRLAANDVSGTEAIFGWLTNRDDHRNVWLLDASRRLGTVWKLGLKARGFRHVPRGDVLFGSRDDSYLQIDLTRFL